MGNVIGRRIASRSYEIRVHGASDLSSLLFLSFHELLRLPGCPEEVFQYIHCETQQIQNLQFQAFQDNKRPVSGCVISIRIGLLPNHSQDTFVDVWRASKCLGIETNLNPRMACHCHCWYPYWHIPRSFVKTHSVKLLHHCEYTTSATEKGGSLQELLGWFVVYIGYTLTPYRTSTNNC